jgi:hypothetical protein
VIRKRKGITFPFSGCHDANREERLPHVDPGASLYRPPLRLTTDEGIHDYPAAKAWRMPG